MPSEEKITYEDKIQPLARAIKTHVPIYGKTRAHEVIREHTGRSGGRQSEIARLAQELYDQRRRLGFNERLFTIRGDKLSALREAITVVLREQTGELSLV
jgi:hypothetical protein